MSWIGTLGAGACGRPPIHGVAKVTIQDLGAIGELIAAVAVVISLVYLGVQIRQNTRQLDENTSAVRATAVYTGLQLIFENRIAIFNDENTATIFHRGMENPDSLDEVEKIRFRLVVANAVDAIFNTYSQTKASGFSPDTWEAQLETAKRVLGTPGGNWFWKNYRNEYRRDFQHEMDAIAGRLD